MVVGIYFSGTQNLKICSASAGLKPFFEGYILMFRIKLQGKYVIKWTRYIVDKKLNYQISYQKSPCMLWVICLLDLHQVEVVGEGMLHPCWHFSFSWLLMTLFWFSFWIQDFCWLHLSRNHSGLEEVEVGPNLTCKWEKIVQIKILKSQINQWTTYYPLVEQTKTCYN